MNNFAATTHIWINGRKVSLQAVAEGKTISLSEFEQNTFDFIRAWLNGEQTFTLHTSGSTGTPKKITAQRAQMIASAKLTAEALGLQAGMNALVCLDTRYIAGKMMIVRSLETGMKMFAVDPCANPMAKIPLDHTMHFTAFVPYQIKTILESKHPHLLDTPFACIIGGGATDADLEERLQVYTTKFYSTYGMTETLSHIALRPLNGKNRSAYYHVLPGITVTLDKRDCLTIRAPYLQEEIVTNDIAEIREGKQFKWLGRLDNVINSGGIKISPEILEERIGQIFTRLHIQNPFFIHGLDDDKLGQKVSLIVAAPFPKNKLQTIHQELLHSFSAYEIPKVILESPAFIYTQTSKVNRQETLKTAREIEGITL